MNALALVGALIWWVLYASIAALFAALPAWVVLRWAERCNVVFNRTYLACLLWSLAGVLLVAALAACEHRMQPPFGALIASPALRIALVADMLVGVLLLWRLIPRADARRIRPGSACLAVAVVMAIAFGAATSLV